MIRDFLKLESTSGIILFVAALAAIILSNSPLADGYQSLFQMPLGVNVASWNFTHPLLFWINEGLMTLFFLLVGLELKREFFEEKFAGLSKVVLPGIAALGGMLVPALIYVFINYPDQTVKGWSVPVATDIAFALGVLSLFGRKIPLELKLFLMALAIFDDLGAILIIALFHTGELSYFSLIAASLLIILLQVMNRCGVVRLTPYLIIGFGLWVCVLSSGVHATVAGVVLALMIPLKGRKNSPARRLENGLHFWVAYWVMPLFALANAGLSLHGISVSNLADSVTLGVILGLVVGKQLGVFTFAWIVIKLGWAKLPKYISWLQMYGVAWLCGIGFTMSLFLGTLAFQEDRPALLINMRLGVLLGSALSGLVGGLILYAAFFKKSRGGRRIEAP